MATEELGHFRRDFGQLAVARQLVTYAEVAISTDVHADEVTLKVEIGELTALVLSRLAEVEVPLVLLLVLVVLDFLLVLVEVLLLFVVK